jgi:hypothetical protein
VARGCSARCGLIVRPRYQVSSLAKFGCTSDWGAEFRVTINSVAAAKERSGAIPIREPWRCSCSPRWRARWSSVAWRALSDRYRWSLTRWRSTWMSRL